MHRASLRILLMSIDTRSVWYRLVHLTPTDAILLLSVSATVVGILVQYVDASTYRTILVAYCAASNAVLVLLTRSRRSTDPSQPPTLTIPQQELKVSTEKQDTTSV